MDTFVDLKQRLLTNLGFADLTARLNGDNLRPYGIVTESQIEELTELARAISIRRPDSAKIPARAESPIPPSPDSGPEADLGDTLIQPLPTLPPLDPTEQLALLFSRMPSGLAIPALAVVLLVTLGPPLVILARSISWLLPTATITTYLLGGLCAAHFWLRLPAQRTRLLSLLRSPSIRWRTYGITVAGHFVSSTLAFYPALAVATRLGFPGLLMALTKGDLAPERLDPDLLQYRTEVSHSDVIRFRLVFLVTLLFYSAILLFLARWHSTLLIAIPLVGLQAVAVLLLLLQMLLGGSDLKTLARTNPGPVVFNFLFLALFVTASGLLGVVPIHLKYTSGPVGVRAVTAALASGVDCLVHPGHLVELFHGPLRSSLEGIVLGLIYLVVIKELLSLRVVYGLRRRPEDWFSIASNYLRAGNFRGALDSMSRARALLKRDDLVPPAYGPLLGWCQLELGDENGADATLGRVAIPHDSSVSGDPRSYWRVIYYIHQHRWGMAAEWMRRMKADNDGNATYAQLLDILQQRAYLS